MKRSLFLLTAYLFISLAPTASFAQFEGKVTFTSYDVEQDGTQEKDEEFTVYFAADRIMMQGEGSYDVVGSIQTEGVLIRMDMEDIVLFNGDKTALKISKADVDAMKQLFGGGQDVGRALTEEAEKVDFQATGKTQNIKGYNSEQFKFRDNEEPDKYVEVWATKELKTNLADVLKSAGEMAGATLPVGGIFEKGYFPLEAYFYSDNELESILKATDIMETTTARKMVEMPPGVKVYGFQQYLFQQFSKPQKKQ